MHVRHATPPIIGSAGSADGAYTPGAGATDAARTTAMRVLQFTIDRNASP